MAMTASKDLVLRIRQALHDLSQPLAVLTGLVDLLLVAIDETDPRLKDIQVVSDQLEKVLQIVSEIRQMAQEASAAEPVIPEPVAHPEL